MEICPKCGCLSAETNHYTKRLICYNKICNYKEIENDEIKKLCEKQFKLRGYLRNE